MLLHVTGLKGQNGGVGEFHSIPFLTLPEVGYWPTGYKVALDFREWCVVLGISITSEEESEVDTVTSLIALITFTTHLLSGFSYLLP